MDPKIRGLYKQLLKTVNRLPAKEADVKYKTKNEIRGVFKDYLNNPTPEKMQELLKTSQQRLSYLKIVTPKLSVPETSKSKFYMFKGKLISGDASEVLPDGRKALKNGVDADDIRRHKYLMERQHFMHRRK